MKHDLFNISEIRAALEAAVVAGKAIMEVHGGDLGTEYKEDDSPVTIADKAAHKVISETLEGTGIPLLSEEMNHPEYRIRKNWERYWLVDPLDGTREFVNGGDDFTVNIALMENDFPVLGIILIPVTREFYIGGTLPGRVYKHQLPRLELSELEGMEPEELKPIVSEHIGVAVSHSHLNKRTLAYVEKLRLKYGEERIRLIRRGSAVKFCMLAEGQAQFYPRYSPCMEWDTAAGQAICETQGARMVRMEDQQPLDYNKDDLYNPPFLLSASGYY
ncbi:3'(2'),5'-bisphosphate nucleotidase CysQ family protein [Robertkochia sediminum]|uniref:3'(2'),5'-bisphosphate nucleotidase CysQ family protein n=1 Tax=Robertkochia sediminum TaxID=2785326 RepID=UPI001931D868|nr:3'(2'),5'-bisphosphate nucleotidase CysQ [Robertkochia sediminum]MBL7471747.1 3'(2'),5'-bisphosphate nucleotidase CysQ [Robertkochia sediminum]